MRVCTTQFLSTGQVRKAVHIDSGVTVAIKIISTEGDGGSGAGGSSESGAEAGAAEESAELRVLKQLKHPHVVKLYVASRTPASIRTLACSRVGVRARRLCLRLRLR